MKKLLVLFTMSAALLVAFSCTKKEEAPATNPADANNPAAQAKVTFLLNVVVEPEGAGTITPANGAFDKGATIELNGNANAGFAFDRWEGDLVGTNNMAQVVMDANKNIKAIFKKADGTTAAAPADQNAAAQPAGGQPAAAPAGGGN
ncbi:MAG: hypothetical protein HQK49_18840 [Oligoflexia bacterium]|nr:hypothetical protein [Oligoflexia bacterium]